MRPYPQNSPQASARFIAMTLLSDGQLDEVELRRLDRTPVLANLGIDGDALQQVMRDFCTDLLREAPVDATGHCQMRPALIARLLEEIDDPVLQRTLCRIALNIVGADHRVQRGESVLLWAALDAWDLKLSDCFSLPSRMPHRPLPTTVEVG